MTLARWAEPLLGLVYPNVCQLCKSGEAVQAQGFVCENCQLSVEPIRPPYCARCGLPYEGEITVEFKCANCADRGLHFRSARAAAEFSGPVREAIHAYKYNHAIWFEEFLAALLLREAQDHLQRSDWDFLVPVPLHWLRRLERSFNQAERLARRLSRSTGIPVNTGLLRRVRATGAQARLTRAERLANIKRAFAYRGKAPLDGERVVLIDDVLTTGATASACAKLLKRNGASVVDVWTVAREVLR